MLAFKPDLSALPPAQRELWGLLGDTPDGFVLYGGTALALRFGHRESVDFDFFSKEPFDPIKLSSSVEYLKGQKLLNVSENTLDSCIQMVSGLVKVSFFGGLNIMQIEVPDIAVDNNLAIASVRDIFGMKCVTVLKRAEIKDYLDIHTIITKGGFSLAEGLASAKAIYGNQYNPIDTLKALTYFSDLPDKLTKAQENDLRIAVEKVALDKLPSILAVNHIGYGACDQEEDI